MGEIQYAWDKPSDCKYCYFWSSKIEGCGLGEDGCYYIIREDTKPKKVTKCTGCPFGVSRPCIGWCTRKILGQIDGI